jgi:hypothetical protein
MKPRRVMLMIEVETRESLARLRKLNHVGAANGGDDWDWWCNDIQQVSVNVIKPKPSKKRK